MCLWMGELFVCFPCTPLQTALPIMGALRDRSVRERHWQSVSAVCGVALNPADPHLRLKALMEARLPQRQEEVGEILTAAAKEAEIEAKLQRIKEDWVCCARRWGLGGRPIWAVACWPF